MRCLIGLVMTAFVLNISPVAARGQADPRIEAAESTVKEGLKDPGSVQFKNVTVKTNSLGETAVCGEYNARNSFGGYVGFESFGVVGNVVSTESADLERLGCLGPDQELARRHSDAASQIAKKLHDQADFSCNVIWTMMDNRFRQQQDTNTVVDAAISAMKNRAQENSSEVSPEVLQAIRTQFETQLAKTATNKKFVEQVRKGDVTVKDVFVQSCVMHTEQTLRVRAGLQ